MPMMTQGSGEKLVRDLKVVVHDAEDLIKATAGDIGEKTREARARLAGALVVAKESLGKAEQSANQSVEIVRGYIRDRPYQCIGWSFLAGVVIGVLSKRR